MATSTKPDSDVAGYLALKYRSGGKEIFAHTRFQQVDTNGATWQSEKFWHIVPEKAERAGIAATTNKASRTLETRTWIRIFPEIQRGDEPLGRAFNG